MTNHNDHVTLREFISEKFEAAAVLSEHRWAAHEHEHQAHATAHEREHILNQQAIDKAERSVDKVVSSAVEVQVATWKAMDERLKKMEQLAANLDGRFATLGIVLGALIILAQAISAWLK